MASETGWKLNSANHKSAKNEKILAFLYELNIKYINAIKSKNKPIGIGNKKAETIFLNKNIYFPISAEVYPTTRVLSLEIFALVQ